MRVHFIGICGTGMGALALLCRARGDEVRGSDTAAYPPMGETLAARGIPVTLGWAAANLQWGADVVPDLVIVGNVCRSDNVEARAAIDGGLKYTSFPAALGDLLIRERHAVVVAGTHGKTTTTTVLARLLDEAGRAPGFFIGGVPRDWDTSCREGSGDVVVLEGDEYDTAFFDKRPKFVHYRARTLVLTSVEYDHADIYADLDAVERAFEGLVGSIPADGKIFAALGTPGDASLARVLNAARAPVERYATGGEGARGTGVPGTGARWVARRVAPGAPRFVVERDGAPVAGAFETSASMAGDHNLMNACAAIACAMSLGAPAAAVREGLARFGGVRRRQEELGSPGGVTVVDDFAHHPTAVRETLAALRQRYGVRRTWALFEPRTQTSRRRVFQDEYARAFDAADRVVIAGAFGADALPEAERLRPEDLAAAISARGRPAVHEPDVEKIVALVAAEARAGDVVAVLSNGGFGGIHAKLLEALSGVDFRSRAGDRL